MKIGELVKSYREKNNISQRQFARMCGVSNGYVSMLEEGRNPRTNEPIVPSLSTLQKISNAIGLTINDLFEMIDDTPIIINASVNKSTPHESNLTEDEQFLLNLFRQIPPERQKVYLALLRGDLNQQ